ncbi:MAG: hypothetical protein ABI333_10780 [bacterium]
MTKPFEICVEELYRGPEEEERFVRCVALPGGEPGLALDREGTVQWMADTPAAYGLWVSMDDRLVLLRGESTDPIVVERRGRTLEAPFGKPVILRDQDELRINGRHLRIHVHGETEAVYEPERLSGSALGRMLRAAAAAAALTVGGAAGATAIAHAGAASAPVGHRDAIEVRARPPEAPARAPMDCTITSQKATRGKTLLIHATCPRTRGLYVGSYGVLLDPKTNQPLKNGSVTIRSVSAQKITAEAARQRKPVKAKAVRFWVR